MAALTIIHFNDVYNIEAQEDEPLGGAARLAAYVKSCDSLNPLVLFSGDALNPSLSECDFFFKLKMCVCICVCARVK